jgi:hypothetical protein
MEQPMDQSLDSRPVDPEERLHVVTPDGGYIGQFPFDVAIECAAETSCYAMDSEGSRIVFRQGRYQREAMPAGVIESVDYGPATAQSV